MVDVEIEDFTTPGCVHETEKVNLVDCADVDCADAKENWQPNISACVQKPLVPPAAILGQRSIHETSGADAKENWQPNISACVQKPLVPAAPVLSQRSIQETFVQSDGLKPPCNSSLRQSAACDTIPPLPTCALPLLPLPPMQPPPPSTPPGGEMQPPPPRTPPGDLCQLNVNAIPALPTARSASAAASNQSEFATPAGTPQYFSARSARNSLGALYMYPVPEAEPTGPASPATRKRAASASSRRNAGEGDASLKPVNVFSAARHGRYNEVSRALAAGFAATYADSNGNTVFHVACQNGHKAIAKLAIRYGGDWNAQNAKGNTGLHFLFAYGYPDIGEYFIQKGACEDIQNDLGNVARQGIR